MKPASLIFVILLTTCSCTQSKTWLTGQYWIPKDINWRSIESLPESRLGQADFRIIYFKNDSVLYILSSYNNIDFNTDSIAYCVEPGYNVYQGIYNIGSKSIYMEYSQVYGTFIVDPNLHRDTVSLNLDSDSTILFIENISYVQTTRLDSYSRTLIATHISISQNGE